MPQQDLETLLDKYYIPEFTSIYLTRIFYRNATKLSTMKIFLIEVRKLYGKINPIVWLINLRDAFTPNLYGHILECSYCVLSTCQLIPLQILKSVGHKNIRRICDKQIYLGLIHAILIICDTVTNHLKRSHGFM